MRDVYWREERAACLRLVMLGLFASTVVCRVAHLSRICTHALTFTPFPFNSVFLLVNLHANAVETCHYASLAFFLTHTLYFCLCLGQVEDWGLSLCAEELFVFVISPFIDCCQGKTPPGDTPEQTWSRISSGLRARYLWTFLFSLYPFPSLLPFYLLPVISPLSSKGETGIHFWNGQNP